MGTSVPRVQRAIARLGIVPVREGRGRRLTPNQVGALRDHLGFAPHVPGISREGMFVLAALNARPLGLRSLRAIARAAGVSPTTASRLLHHLVADGLVEARHERLAEGAVTDAVIYTPNRDSQQWARIVTSLRLVVPPGPAQPRPEPKTVPRRLWHHFWNANPSSLRLPADADYIAARLLRSDDPGAVSWAAASLPASSIEKVAALRGLSERDRGWLRRLAAGATR